MAIFESDFFNLATSRNMQLAKLMMAFSPLASMSKPSEQGKAQLQPEQRDHFEAEFRSHDFFLFFTRTRGQDDFPQLLCPLKKPAKEIEFLIRFSIILEVL
jgi:hypothetical protein